MKKIVAASILVFIIAMGIMVGWGFLDKQAKEKSSFETSSSTNDTTNNIPSQNQQASNEQPTPTTNKLYSLADLSTHSKASDCWIAIDKNVYDVTSYLDLHPGGADLIIANCGKDATKAFNTQGGRGGGHSNKAKTLLQKYLIGTLN